MRAGVESGIHAAMIAWPVGFQSILEAALSCAENAKVSGTVVVLTKHAILMSSSARRFPRMTARQVQSLRALTIRRTVLLMILDVHVHRAVVPRSGGPKSHEPQFYDFARNQVCFI
ncbi:unnamed protein product [Polarella glacialis]|uniref:Uncharacterized protein n=1 Tax=Polarella glacialis TaxID=89957 RepID=A0A813FNW4_POLGL|nr:unnamed protein product [Polarella glacialis]